MIKSCTLVSILLTLLMIVSTLPISEMSTPLRLNNFYSKIRPSVALYRTFAPHYNSNTPKGFACVAKPQNLLATSGSRTSGSLPSW